MKAILLIDHGSRRDAANEMMDCMANLVQAMAGPDVVVRYAHMELAEPSIAAGVRELRRCGSDRAHRVPVHALAGQALHGRHPAHGGRSDRAASPRSTCA